ncbi:MAG: 4a-hydroxytetrahydrobiopterin dehydratase [Candidatus Tectomicrobia bacterium]|nr:4a-hydroxytetrahydrobiopterin dehydratase [Candidatus Tectomicrobia bacterium]
MANPLSEAEVGQRLAATPGWERHGDEIRKTFVFKHFVQAMAFVNQVAEEAEAAAHHPDILITWNKVRLSLTTHDAGRLTEKDFALAAAADRRARKVAS